jgi:hypothetical protein
MPGHALVSFFQVAAVVGSGLTAAKLLFTGLHRRYRVFFWYFCFRVANGIWPFFFDLKSNAYAYLWALTDLVSLLFYVLVVMELCRLVLERHPGLYSLSRWAMGFGIVASLTLSFLSLLPKITPAMTQSSRKLGYFYAGDRGVTFCLAVFLLLMLFLLSRYPVPLSRNVILHFAIYTIFFLSNTLSLIFSSVFGLKLYRAVDIGLMGVSTACALAWAFLLNPKGEEVRLTIPHLGAEHEERLLYQLDSLNKTLLKASRK